MNEMMQRLYEAAKILKGVETQAQLAAIMNKSPQVVNNWESRGISSEGLVEAEIRIGCSPAWIKTGVGLPVSKNNEEALAKYKSAATGSADLVAPDRQSASDNVEIPKLAARGSMGLGDLLTYDGDQIVDFMPISKSWVARNVSAPINSLRVITGHGNSMEPTFRDGDLLLVDTSKTAVDVDGVYVLSAHGQLFIKSVRRRMTGEYEISSDNPTFKTIDVLDGNSEVTVHGRVVWAWNGRSL